MFVSEFENEKDRDYYVNEDPVHDEFKKFVLGVAEVVRVVDFEPGKF